LAKSNRYRRFLEASLVRPPRRDARDSVEPGSAIPKTPVAPPISSFRNSMAFETSTGACLPGVGGTEHRPERTHCDLKESEREVIRTVASPTGEATIWRLCYTHRSSTQSSGWSFGTSSSVTSRAYLDDDRPRTSCADGVRSSG